MGAVKKWTGKATEVLVGGKPKDSYSRVQDAMSDEEKARLAEIEKSLTDMLAQQDPNADLGAMFKEQLLDFTSRDFGPNPTPEQLAQATSLVDQTFTNPANEQLRQLQGDTEAQAQARAAAMGRNGNLDASTQAAVAAEMARARLGVNQERGSRIGNLALDYNNQNYARAGEKLTTLSQGSAFLNNLAQQAFSNKLGLLNARSVVGNTFANERYQNRINGGGGTSSGILTNIASINSGIQNVASGGMADVFKQSLSGGGMGGGGGGGLGSGIAANGTNYNLGVNYGTAAGAGGATGGVGGLATLASDERLKTAVEEASSDVAEFLDVLTPYSYLYKDEKHGHGVHYSVMAQDLEKSKIGKTLVQEKADGKHVDLSKAVLALLATNASLNKRISELEARVK